MYDEYGTNIVMYDKYGIDISLRLSPAHLTKSIVEYGAPMAYPISGDEIARWRERNPA